MVAPRWTSGGRCRRGNSPRYATYLHTGNPLSSRVQQTVYQREGWGGALPALFSPLPASLSLSRDPSLGQASPAPFPHPVNMAVCFLMNMDFHHPSLWG